jgi:hypothetical protein
MQIYDYSKASTHSRMGDYFFSYLLPCPHIEEYSNTLIKQVVFLIFIFNYIKGLAKKWPEMVVKWTIVTTRLGESVFITDLILFYSCFLNLQFLLKLVRVMWFCQLLLVEPIWFTHFPTIMFMSWFVIVLPVSTWNALPQNIDGWCCYHTQAVYVDEETANCP